MEPDAFKALVKDIVAKSMRLKDSRTTARGAPVNYSAIFCQSMDEYTDFVEVAEKLGRVVDDTPTGPLFLIDPLDTVAGKLKLVKVRRPDPARKERGDADFTVSDYDSFKSTYLSKPGFKLIRRPNFEMIELIDGKFDVLAYFSNPPLDRQLGV